MQTSKKQRLRDPVHGLIVFRDERDMAVWELLNTPEFQRLRRIKQLGVSELTFPGATHTRFAHSVGVFHTARQLLGIIERELGKLDNQRADIALLAAILHDVGHGPFSHAFEEVQKRRKATKKHEAWSSDMIRNVNGRIWPILVEYGQRRYGNGDQLAQEVANLLVSDVPQDIYHAVVSSSFDADRLDYLRRDRMMTGSGAGAIDFDWLLDNLKVESLDIGVDEADDETPPRVLGLCLDRKALQAAEAFLLARYHLYTQVYFHKVTRGVEQMIGALVKRVATLVSDDRIDAIGLPNNNPMVRFLREDGGTLANYMAIDDFVAWGAFERMTDASDPFVKDISSRPRERRLYKSLDLEALAGDDPDIHRSAVRRIEQKFETELKKDIVLKDKTELSIYGEVGFDEDNDHKRLMIRLSTDKLTEISRASKLIQPLAPKRPFVRYYFADEASRDEARKMVRGANQ